MSETHRSLSYVYLKKKTSLGHADSFLVFCYSRTKRLQSLVIIRVFDLEIRLSEVATLETVVKQFFFYDSTTLNATKTRSTQSYSTHRDGHFDTRTVNIRHKLVKILPFLFWVCCVAVLPLRFKESHSSVAISSGRCHITTCASS